MTLVIGMGNWKVGPRQRPLNLPPAYESRGGGARNGEEEPTMIVLTKGSFTKPEALAPHVDDEMRVVGELKAEGAIEAL